MGGRGVKPCSFDSGYLRGYTGGMVFVIALGALAVGGGLILLIGHSAPEAGRRRGGGAGARRPPMPFERWRELVVDLLEAVGFEIALQQASGDELEIVARSNEPLRAGRYLIRAPLAPPGDRVGADRLLALGEAVEAEGAERGIVITPHAIEAAGAAEAAARLELVDGPALRRLIARHLPDLLPSLDRHHGF